MIPFENLREAQNLLLDHHLFMRRPRRIQNLLSVTMSYEIIPTPGVEVRHVGLFLQASYLRVWASSCYIIALGPSGPIQVCLIGFFCFLVFILHVYSCSVHEFICWGSIIALLSISVMVFYLLILGNTSSFLLNSAFSVTCYSDAYRYYMFIMITHGI